MTTPKIPKGWRKLRAGTIIMNGDMYFGVCSWQWRDAGAFEVGRLADRRVTYIREIRLKTRTKTKGRKK
jgi:hypothetical protein